MSAALIDLARQCCDADDYLDMGYVCAKDGQCYNSLRTIGDTFWFGTPYVFNTTQNIFFYLHFFLMALVAISAFYLLKKMLPTLVFLLALGFLIWPTFFHTLSDTPATLFFIEGIVLAFIGMQRNSAIAYFAAGTSLGLSALLRTAYFMPLVVAGILFCIDWLWKVFHQQKHTRSKQQWPAILILGFVIPVVFQFINTWKHTGEWHFVSEARSRSMMNLHLNSDAVGYDTVLPQAGLFWTGNCSPRSGLLPALKSADFSSATCILKGRLQFYLGSYASSTYLGDGTRNFFDNNAKIKIAAAESNHSGYMVESKSLLPLPAGQYRYSVLLQAAKNNQRINVAIQQNNVTISNAAVVIGNAPQPYRVDISSSTISYIIARITSIDEFTTQTVTLEPGLSAQGYVRQEKSSTGHIGENTSFITVNRFFSNIYWMINIIVASVAVYFLFKLWINTRSPVVVFIATLLLSVFLQCLVIIPEQRYIQSFLGSCWLFCLLWLSNNISSLHSTRQQLS